MEAYHRDGFPVTIIKPSTAHGPKMGLLRQIAWEFAWIDRVCKGKPIAVCGDCRAIHQFLYVDDAALCFAGVLENNAASDKRTTWSTADSPPGGLSSRGDGRHWREVSLVGVPLDTLKEMNVPAFEICRDIFSHNCYYSGEKLFRDVPEFQPRVSLQEGMSAVLEVMRREGRIPNSDGQDWENRIIEAQLRVRAVKAQ